MSLSNGETPAQAKHCLGSLVEEILHFARCAPFRMMQLEVPRALIRLQALAYAWLVLYYNSDHGIETGKIGSVINFEAIILPSIAVITWLKPMTER